VRKSEVRFLLWGYSKLTEFAKLLYIYLMLESFEGKWEGSSENLSELFSAPSSENSISGTLLQLQDFGLVEGFKGDDGNLFLTIIPPEPTSEYTTKTSAVSSRVLALIASANTPLTTGVTENNITQDSTILSERIINTEGINNNNNNIYKYNNIIFMYSTILSAIREKNSSILKSPVEKWSSRQICIFIAQAFLVERNWRISLDFKRDVFLVNKLLKKFKKEELLEKVANMAKFWAKPPTVLFLSLPYIYKVLLNSPNKKSPSSVVKRFCGTGEGRTGDSF